MNITETKLNLIAKKAKDEPTIKFNALMHHFNLEYLLVCFKNLENKKAPGIDKRTKESYTEQEIKEALALKVSEIQRGKYQPQPVKRVYIKKENNSKMRPLGMPTVIDKTIQLATRNILEAIYEADFLDCSYGYRPNRDAHQALKTVNHMLMQNKVNWVIDADIKGFFDNLDHHWLMECLAQRISDQKFKGLVFKMLKSGILENGSYQATEVGTPQGGIVSPVLANIYLHYVLDLWFELVIKKELNSEMQLVRYADDFVIGVQYQDQAQKLLLMLRQRLAKFGLTLAEDKTKIIEFGRFARENKKRKDQTKPETFDFLGLTHYCSTTRDGRYKLGVKTSRKKLKRATVAMKDYLKKVRSHLKQEEIWKTIASKLNGHYNYYGVSGNFGSLKSFYSQTIKQTFKWMNRRSQKQSYNWNSFSKYLEKYPLPRPKLKYQIYNTW
jgi:group II intron reverse transcriptase/maturase